MSTLPDADIRTALDEAAHGTGLTFDPDAVLHSGHRAVRRRRVATTALVAAATAAVAVIAVQLGSGPPRALPALPPAVSRTTPTASTGPLIGSTFSDGIRQGKGVEVSVTPQGDGTVRETWTLYDGTTRLATVTRAAPATRSGQASFLMPGESRQQGIVYGYALTGPQGAQDGYVMTQLVTAPDAATGQGAGLSLRDARTQAVVGSVFWQEVQRPEQVIGVTWNRTNPTTQGIAWLGDGAALRTGRRGGVDAAVVTVSPRTALLLWRQSDRFSFGPRPLPSTDPGTLQVTVAPHSAAVAGSENDLAVGWVAGPSITLTSSDPGDTFTLAYGAPIGGRTPFVARANRTDVKGTVTVTGGGETQTLAAWNPQP